MAISPSITYQYTSSHFVESAGLIPFHLSTRQIILLHLVAKNQYVLPKGRRNCGETRQEAALREVREETGYSCHFLPVTMSTRAPPAIETGPTDDVPWEYASMTEPFTLQIRHLNDGKSVKLIWWYVGVVDEDEDPKNDRPGEEKFAVEFCGYEEAMEKLTFQHDRDMVRRAIDTVVAIEH